MARHVKKGDRVMVTAGNDRGATGRVLRVDPKRETVTVEGVNKRYRHVRPNQQNQQGGRLEQEMPIHISNVSPISPSTNQPTRVRFETREDGSKVRVAVNGGDVLDTVRSAKS
jgi:large subunit ribosomal protein L24